MLRAWLEVSSTPTREPNHFRMPSKKLLMNTAVTVQREVAALAIVHHANQYIVTDGYDNRVGISGIVGTSSSQTGLLRVLKLHERYRVPFSLHISGTFLESLTWHSPEF